ncbi:MAG: FAD-containing oxidoreductase [Pyrinomonadaceae bacterium]|nr:FAD-containing oxidoreductase [Pyrinomonadaceae bacterium]
MANKFDAIVIGTGQAGPSLTNRLAESGMKVAVIERKLFGGTCVNTGCIPTKTLVASARAIHMARRGDEYGFSTGHIEVDMKRVKARKDEVSGASNSSVEHWLKNLDNVTAIEGHARFTGTKTIEVNGEELEADKIFINVGGRAFIPDMPGLDEVQYLTNSSMMDVDFVPEHLIIIGGSYIGLEFAQMYRRFGSEVTVVEKSSRLIAREDEDVSAVVLEVLEREGINVRLNAECITTGKKGNKVVVGVDCENGEPKIEGSHLFLAVGRTPNTHDLGLEHTGVKVNERGYIQVDDQLRTNVEGIWALGDVNGRGAFTHTAYNDFEIVAGNLLDDDPRRVTDRIMCYALYVDPPLGRIGMTEKQARESGRNVLIGKRPMTKVGRAKEKGDTDGFIKVLVDADSEEILGAAILGLNGDEVVHSILDVMYAGGTYKTISRAVHIHPTVTELVPTTLQDLKPLGAQQG